MTHELKILPCHYQQVLSGEKQFEIRDNRDRGFQKGDKVVLKEYDPNKLLGSYTGGCWRVKITYVTNFEQKDGFVVFGFRKD